MSYFKLRPIEYNIGIISIRNTSYYMSSVHVAVVGMGNHIIAIARNTPTTHAEVASLRLAQRYIKLGTT